MEKSTQRIDSCGSYSNVVSCHPRSTPAETAGHRTYPPPSATPASIARLGDEHRSGRYSLIARTLEVMPIFLQRGRPLLAQVGSPALLMECLLIVVEQTSRRANR
jgi:hypothetical protein